ncbi:hypothetical protein GCM10027449_06390 [Sinomonas notoginsengisoli]|uniref:fumarylacetoacetate hydrolase family protein n=1 Tax=Sinomonas notoginsengisoli TaxID=1457311 RepID=UPI0027DEDEB0|nr:fumarylacetoacetate hydrolase family protein [Sinomonas notoginsengisoli]
MAITEIETIRTALQPNLTLVAIRDQDGTLGLGETFFGATSVEAYIHDVAAPLLAEGGADTPSAAAAALEPYIGYSGSGAEARGNSAIDIALWDLLAKRASLPLNELLGGRFNDGLPVYNTCAGYSYINAQSCQSSSNWGTPLSADSAPADRYEDLWAFHHEPAKLARELVDAGYPGMKIWPFDLAAEQSRGSRTADLRPGLAVLDAIRNEVGDEINIYLELHGQWTLSGASRLLYAVEPFGLTWAEDPIRSDQPAALSALRARTPIPIAVGESTGAGNLGYKALFDNNAIDTAILDLGWCGGVTQGRKAAHLADSHGLPIALHDCTGPVALATAVHLATATPNVEVQESCPRLLPRLVSRHRHRPARAQQRHHHHNVGPRPRNRADERVPLPGGHLSASDQTVKQPISRRTERPMDLKPQGLKFVRLGPLGAELPAVIAGDGAGSEKTYDLSPLTADIDGAFLAGGGIDEVRRQLADGALPELDAEGLRVGSPVARPSAIVCVGMNYAAHAAESGAQPPKAPMIFLKTPNTVAGPDDTAFIPRNSTTTDWEVELGVVIGQRAGYLCSVEDAASHIAGYLVANDLSERTFQMEDSGGQWSKGKCAPGFSPLGPWLVPAEEVDVHNLRLRSWVNAEPRQDSSTADMIFPVHYLIHHVSQYMALEPGDVVMTGTPEGVALSGRFPYLAAGDVVELEVEGLGRQRQTFAQA